VGDADEVGGTEAQEFQIYESFVKEKGALLGYIHDVVHCVALKQGFDSAQFFEDKTVKVGSKINSEQDLFNIKNRIIIIVSRYQIKPFTSSYLRNSMKDLPHLDSSPTAWKFTLGFLNLFPYSWRSIRSNQLCSTPFSNESSPLS